MNNKKPPTNYEPVSEDEESPSGGKSRAITLLLNVYPLHPTCILIPRLVSSGPNMDYLHNNIFGHCFFYRIVQIGSRVYTKLMPSQ